jgi:hypothetical protein
MSIVDIFTCQSEVDGSLEHILPIALGGSLKSRALIGLETNNLFGRTLDSAIVEPFKLVQNLLELESRRGKKVGYTIDRNAGSYRLRSGMRPEIRKIGFEEVVEGDKNIIRITARNREEAKHLINAVNKKYDGKLDFSTAQITSHSEYVEEPFSLQVSIGGPCQLRAIAKCAFEAAALALGSEVILSEAFDGIRSWIYEGAVDYKKISAADYHEPVSFCRHDYREELWSNLPADPELRFAHRIFVFAECGGGAWAAIELFGHFRFSINLCERHNSASVSWAMLLDPINHKHSPLEPPPLPPISAVDVRSYLEIDTNAFRDAWNLFLERAERLQLERWINQIVANALDDCFPKYGETILPEHIDALTTCLSESFVKFKMRISSKKELTLADLWEINSESNDPD